MIALNIQKSIEQIDIEWLCLNNTEEKKELTKEELELENIKLNTIKNNLFYLTQSDINADVKNKAFKILSNSKLLITNVKYNESLIDLSKNAENILYETKVIICNLKINLK